jgi:hypothetical protein
VRKLHDFDRLVAGNVAEHLGRATCGPVDFQERDPQDLSQADGLLERVGAETAPQGNVAVDCYRILTHADQLDLGTASRAEERRNRSYRVACDEDGRSEALDR